MLVVRASAGSSVWRVCLSSVQACQPHPYTGSLRPSLGPPPLFPVLPPLTLPARSYSGLSALAPPPPPPTPPPGSPRHPHPTPPRSYFGLSAACCAIQLGVLGFAAQAAPQKELLLLGIGLGSSLLNLLFVEPAATKVCACVRACVGGWCVYVCGGGWVSWVGGLCVCGWVGGVFDDGTEHARMWQCIDWARGGGSSSHADVELSREAPSVSTSRMLRRHVFSELCRAASVLVDPLGLALRTVVGIGGVCYNGTGRASLCQCIAWPREGAAEHLLSCLAEAPVRQQCGSCRVHSASASAELSAYDMIHVIGALQGALWYMVFLTH